MRRERKDEKKHSSSPVDAAVLELELDLADEKVAIVPVEAAAARATEKGKMGTHVPKMKSEGKKPSLPPAVQSQGLQTGHVAPEANPQQQLEGEGVAPMRTAAKKNRGTRRHRTHHSRQESAHVRVGQPVIGNLGEDPAAHGEADDIHGVSHVVQPGMHATKTCVPKK